MGGDLFEAPERVGRYEILLPIAKGGMATVYLARAEGHGGFDRYVALKLTLPHLRDDPEFSAHLLDEAKLVAHIRHTNVVPVLDVGQDKLGVFLVMDYVAGDTLAGLTKAAALTGTPLARRVGLRILVDALEGLHAAHEHGDEDGYPLHLVHRDFSPQNILVGTDGVGRLTDFGIAKAASRVGSTGAGLIKGKMSYVSPEQARGLTLDRRCDLWAAGVIAWEIMCGRKLNAPNDPKAMLATVKQEPPRIRSVAADAPEGIEEVIANVLKLDPDQRIATAETLARDLATAARAAGMFAETHEVSEHVKRLAAPVLADRKQRLASARRLRIGSSPDPIATTIGVPSPLVDGGAASTRSRVENDAFVEDDIAISVDESVPPPALLEPPAEPPVPAIASVAPPGPKLALIGAAVGVVIMIALVAITLKIASGRDGEGAVGAAASASASPTTALPATAVTAPAAAAVKAEEVAQAQFLALATNAPVAEVRIGDRVVDMVIAAPNVNVELEPEETEHALVVTLKSADGRVATKTLARGELEAKVAFPATAPKPVTRGAGKSPRHL